MPVTGSTSSGQMGDCVHTTATKPRSKSSSGKTGRQNSKKESKSKRGGSMKKRDPSDMPAEMDMVMPKQNGSVVEGVDQQEEESDMKHSQSSSAIKGMWKKAFKNLKSNEKQTSLKKGSLRRKDSKDQEEEESEERDEIDPVYSLLKCAADLPKASKVCGIHSQCSGHHSKHGGHGDSSASTSKTSSPSSSGSPSSAMHDLVANSLGSDFKQYYKLTSPAGKKVPSSLENFF